MYQKPKTSRKCGQGGGMELLPTEMIAWNHAMEGSEHILSPVDVW